MGRILMVDVETTGLDPETCVLLEVAAVVVDLDDLEVKDSFEQVISQPKELLDRMDSWCTKQHGQSGLTSECLISTFTLEQVTTNFLDFIEKNWPGGPVVKTNISGSSVWFDKGFLAKHMPVILQRLSHQILDVSSLAVLFQRKYHIGYKKKKAHRAMDDILESLGELKHYCSFIQPKKEEK